ncbi:MAG: hypothetical protein FWG42_07460 [Clostridiales bacterium]|nr:hypothetical protein [Clostridiales bacterium]
MACFICGATLKQYSKEVVLSCPVRASSIPNLLNMPEEYINNIVAVRANKVLMQDEMVFDSDEIRVFTSVMGG